MINRRITLCLALVAIIVSSLVRTSECSRYHSDDSNKSPRHRHRHRHDSTSVASSRRNHESLSSARRSPWPQQDDDYEDAQDVDDDDDEEDEDYDIEPRTRTLYERNYQPARSAQRNYHSRFEPRYPLRYYQTGHHPSPWYRGATDEDADRRRNSRYGGAVGSRGHRQRPGRDRTHHEDRRRGEAAAPVGSYPRNHEFEDPEEDPEDEVELDHDGGYDRSVRRWRFEDDSDENSQDYRGVGSGASRWRNSRRHRPYDHYDVTPESKGHRGRQEFRRNDWKPWTSNSPASSGVSAGQRTEDDDWTDRRRKTVTNHRKRPGRLLPIEEADYEDVEEDRNESRGPWSNKKSRNNLIDHGFNAGSDRRKDNDLDDRDFDYEISENGDARKSDKRREEEEKEEEEENIWKEDDEIDDPDDDDQDFDNTNYYKSEDEPPYKTFDDIIKSLTSEDPTTPKTTIRREYRNTGIEKYLRRDAYGNMYDSRNVTVITKPAHDIYNVGRTSNWTNNAANRWRLHPSKPDVANYPNVRDVKKLSNSIGDTKEHERKRIRAKLDEPQPRTKSLEQEYDEDYDNNEKDEDAVKVAGERTNEMQADVTTEYADEDNETETEGETSAPLSTTSTTTSTTTTTTTTTPRPIMTTTPSRVTQERRDSRSYDSSTAPQSNALQQTTHGSHKWQSLTTRDGDKDSKGRVQQNEKNGKADIKEAIQHAIKVSREGSCQWPRARVIPVRDVYPSPSTTYVPHCAILHRCSDDTGCCRSEALTCVPKISHRVELYFYTNNIGGGSVVEKLSFYNHTECECKERVEYGAPSDKTSVTNEPKHHPTAVSPPQNIRRPPQRKPCKCPSEFTPRIVEGVCQCNCYENDDNCIRIRRGKGYFSFRDRLCIQNEQCAAPMCEFGDYMRRQGKCPRKRDKFNAIATSLNLHHRIRS